MKVSHYPYIIKKIDLETNYIQVTKSNKDVLFVQGRILYIIEKTLNTISVNGVMHIQPRFKKGWYTEYRSHCGIGPDFSAWIEKNESIEDYMIFGKFILSYVDKQELFIKKGQPLVRYEFGFKRIIKKTIT